MERQNEMVQVLLLDDFLSLNLYNHQQTLVNGQTINAANFNNLIYIETSMFPDKSESISTQDTMYLHSSKFHQEPLNSVPQSGEPLFILSNVRSLLPKIDDLETILKASSINMAFITETWLSENIHDSAVEGVIELTRQEEACAPLLNHLFHLNYYLNYKTNVLKPCGYI